jgi:hypothetical protein
MAEPEHHLEEAARRRIIPRLSLRTVLILVALAAVWMAVVRTIEGALQRDEIASLRTLESAWLADYKSVASPPSPPPFKEYDAIHTRRLSLEQNAAAGTPSFSGESIVFTIFYLWVLILIYAIRSERSIEHLGISPDEFARSMKRRFLLWLKLIPVAPIAIVMSALLILGFVPSSSALFPWCRAVMSSLLLLPLLHALIGVVICREMRWPAFLVGIITTGFGSTVALAVVSINFR